MTSPTDRPERRSGERRRRDKNWQERREVDRRARPERERAERPTERNELNTNGPDSGGTPSEAEIEDGHCPTCGQPDPSVMWVCFHCGAEFTEADYEAAQEHFGEKPGELEYARCVAGSGGTEPFTDGEPSNDDLARWLMLHTEGRRAYPASPTWYEIAGARLRSVGEPRRRSKMNERIWWEPGSFENEVEVEKFCGEWFETWLSNPSRLVLRRPDGIEVTLTKAQWIAKDGGGLTSEEIRWPRVDA